MRLTERRERLDAKHAAEVKKLISEIAHVKSIRLSVEDRGWAYPSPALRQVVAEFRAERGWSVRLMARQCGVEPRQIKNIESQARSVYLRKDALERIVRRLGLDPERAAAPAPHRLADRATVHDHPFGEPCGDACPVPRGTPAPAPEPLRGTTPDTLEWTEF